MRIFHKIKQQKWNVLSNHKLVWGGGGGVGGGVGLLLEYVTIFSFNKDKINAAT